MLVQIGSFYSDLKTESEDRQRLKQVFEDFAEGDEAKAIANFKEIKRTSLEGPDFDPSPKDKARLHVLRAKIARDVGDLKTAEHELEEAVKNDEIFSTLYNLAVLKIKLGKPGEAEPLIEKILKLAESKTDLDQSIAALMKFEISLAMSREGSKNKSDARIKILKAAIATLENANHKENELTARLRVALAVSHFDLGNQDEFQKFATELIDSSDGDSSERLPPRLDKDLIDWRHVYTFCTEIYNRPNSTALIAAFYASCLRRSHGAQSALPYAKYALSLRPDEPTFIGQTADLLLDLKQIDAAKKILVPEGKTPVVGSRLATRAINLLGLREPAAATEEPVEGHGAPVEIDVDEDAPNH